jgi:SAM-dependent methyltransferase
MKKIKSFLRKIPFIKKAKIIAETFRHRYSLPIRTYSLFSFFSDYRIYRKLQKNDNFSLETKNLYPRIYDKTTNTPVDPIYFYQNCWCAKKIFETKPEKHFDVGSSAELVGILSGFVPTTMIDIRPLPVRLKNLSFVQGSILNLPFSDSEISSLSAICVIEHIGLGRYGDHLDQFGSEKSAKELERVLKSDGSLYISVPVDSKNIVYFNAHRAFTREYVIKLFNNLTLVEEKYVYGYDTFDSYDPLKGFGTGLFHFKKPR